MTDKSLKSKAVKIQGKSYVLVADRVVYFNEICPNGCIQTTLISEPHDDEIVVKATIIPDTTNSLRFFTGYSQAIKGTGFINKTSALENAETSAVGRALALMGIGVIESIASADEINKARTYPVNNSLKKVPQEDETKLRIKKICDLRDPLLKTKEQYENFVKEKTGFDLIPANYEAIIDTLKV